MRSTASGHTGRNRSDAFAVLELAFYRRETWMAEREVQIAQTEALFRDVNERIADSAGRFNARDAEFVCECADPACAERVPATLDQYEDVRSDGAHFLLAPGHELPEVERVVKRPQRRSVVVEKFNSVVARTVRRLNPRANAV
jgi:hypothetical protein